jgi:hypothetical protein
MLVIAVRAELKLVLYFRKKTDNAKMTGTGGSKDMK